MRIIFGGAEVPSNRNLLVSMGVKDLGLSYWNLCKRGLPKTKDYLIAERFPDDVRIHVDSGGLSLDSSGFSQNEAVNYAADYEAFVAINESRLESANELDSAILGGDFIKEQRSTFWHDFGRDRFRPIWRGDAPALELFGLSAEYPHIAIPGAALDNDASLASRTQALSRQHGTTFHGLALARPDELRQVPFETVTTLAWLSPMRRGETVVWDGSRLVRYPKHMKEQARKRLSSICERAGLDYQRVVADDNVEVAKLAVWSYQQLEERMDRRFTVIKGGDNVPANKDTLDDPGSAESGVVVPDISRDEVVKISARDPREMMPLPVFGYEMRTIVDVDENGRDVLKEVPVVQSTQGSLRQCNTCFVASNCPAMKPNSTCAFNLPVEIRTKDQLRALLNSIIEMQGARVAFARFSEELSGGYPDPNVSQEIDRLFKLVAQLKDLENNKDVMRMTIERQTSGGVLSAIFGDRAQALKELPNGGIDAQATDALLERGLTEGRLT